MARDKHERTDRELIELCRGQGGQPQAFRVLYERYAGPVFTYVRALIGEEALAEDALQEAFVRLYRSLASYDPSRPLKPYIMRLAHNAAIDRLRARKGERPRPLGELPGGDQPADEAARRELSAGVEAALAELEAPVRSILILRHVQGLKLREIAEVFSCTERTARNRLRSAALLLERALRKRGVAPREANS